MEGKAKIGIVGTLFILAAFGGGMYLSDSELQNAYVCSITEEWGVFNGGISSTGITAYPFKENRTQAKQCSGGKWVKLTTYADGKGITVNEFLQPKPQPIIINQEVSGKKWVCNNIHCVEI